MESLLAGQQGDAREADARKLYMAMTRASHRLVMLSTAEVPADALPLFRAG
jgi:ATP-dependent exoDNAse (exonuclease V) beta subunit